MQALKRLERLAAEHPYFPGTYEMLFRICADANTPVPESVLTGNALIACSENAELSMQLGEAFAEKSLWLNAIGAYGFAAALEPRNKEALERHAEAIKRAK